jgi:oxygen-independent coproporphyrinogen-3 oxidase
VLREVQEVPSRERAGEYLMMRLRTTAGLNPDEYERRYLLPFAPLEEALEELAKRHLAVRTYDGRWHLTPQGFLLSNTIISDLLIIQEQSETITKRR